MLWTAGAWWSLALIVLVLANPTCSAPVTGQETTDIPQILQLVRDAKHRADSDRDQFLYHSVQTNPLVNFQPIEGGQTSWKAMLARYRNKGRGRKTIHDLSPKQYPGFRRHFDELERTLSKLRHADFLRDYYFLRYLELDQINGFGGDPTRDVAQRFRDGTRDRSEAQAAQAFRDVDEVVNMLVWTQPEYVVASNMLAAKAVRDGRLRSPVLYELVLPAARRAAQQNPHPAPTDTLHSAARREWRRGQVNGRFTLREGNEHGALLQRFVDAYKQLLAEAEQDGSVHAMHGIDPRMFSLHVTQAELNDLELYLAGLRSSLQQVADLDGGGTGSVQLPRIKSSHRSTAQAGPSTDWHHDGPSVPLPPYSTDTTLSPPHHLSPIPYPISAPGASFPPSQHEPPNWPASPPVYLYHNDATFPRDRTVPTRPTLYDWSDHLSGANAPHRASSFDFDADPTDPALHLGLGSATHPSDRTDTTLHLGIGVQPAGMDRGASTGSGEAPRRGRGPTDGGMLSLGPPGM